MQLAAATVIDLFSGAGGFSLGLHAAGARIVAAVDASPTAAATFRQNFGLLQHPDAPLILAGEDGRLERLDLESFPGSSDIVIGGPPCQGFSRIGRAKLASLANAADHLDPRNELYQRFVQAVRLWQPRGFLMENVPGMLSLRGQNVAETVGEELAACGYRVGYAVLNAAWYGVPQFRERLFFVGVRRDLGVVPSVPATTHDAELPSGYIRPADAATLPLEFVQHFALEVPRGRAQVHACTVEDAIGDLPPITEHLGAQDTASVRGQPRTVRAQTTPATSWFARMMHEWPGLPGSAEVHDHVIRRTPRDYLTFARMRPEDRYPEALAIAEQRFREALADLDSRGEAPGTSSPEFGKLRRAFVPPYPASKFVDKWRKLTRQRPAWTVPAHLSKDAYSHIHYDPVQARAISVREAARLQSFPDGFRFIGNMGDCFTQIGNAVPPLLAWALGAHLLELIGRRSCRIRLPAT